MHYRELILSSAILLGTALGGEAQERWEGLYGGLSLTGSKAKSQIAGSAVHKHEAHGVGLGLHVGYNFANGNGFVWGPELMASSLPIKERKVSAGPIGTTEFKGSYIISPRVRAGFATDRIYYYGFLGLGISDLGTRQPGASKKNSVSASLGLGAEFALNDLWSAKAEITHYAWKTDNQTFGAARRNVDSTAMLLTLGVSRKF